MKTLKPMIFSFLILVFFLQACKKEPSPITTPKTPDDSQQFFQMLWQVPITEDTAKVISDHKFVHNGNVINQKGFDGPNKILSMYDGNTGDELWSWEDAKITDGSEVLAHEGMILTDSKLMVGTSNHTYFLNLENGTTIFEDSPDLSDKRFLKQNSILDNYIFRTTKPRNETDASFSELVFYDIKDLQSNQLVYKALRTNGFSPAILGVNGYKNSNGDQILIFQNRQYRFSPGRGKVDLITYNFTQDTIVWIREDLTATKSSNVQAPIIYNQKIYFAGGLNMYCLDLDTGEEIWQKLPSPTSSGLATSNYKIIDGKLIVNDDEWNLMALDPNSGETIWHIPEVGNRNSLAYYGHILFTASDDLIAIDLKKGEIIDRVKPNKSLNDEASFFWEAIAVDEENKRVYTSDGLFLICYEINP